MTHSAQVPPPPPAPGRLIRQYRLARGLTQEWIGRRAGVSNMAISSIENGRSWGSVRTRWAIADALGLHAPDVWPHLEDDDDDDVMPAAEPPAAPEVALPDLMSVAVAARRLHVSEMTVRRLIDNRDLGHLRIAGCIRIARADLEDYVLSATVQRLR